MTEISAWMPLYIGDYLADTMHLSAVEHGAYLLLIMHYWRSGTPLPDDDRQLASIARTERKAWTTDIAPIVRKFFQPDNGYLRHKRVDHELVKAGRHVEQRREAGKASAEARRRQRKGDEPPNENPTAVTTEGSTDPPTNCQRNGRPSPSPSPEERKQAARANELKPIVSGPKRWEDDAIKPAGLDPKLPEDHPTNLRDKDRPSVNGYFLDHVFSRACELAGIDPDKAAVTWKPVVDWLKDGIEPEQIYAAVRRCAERSSYNPPRSLGFFDPAVREQRRVAA